ncbi:hypothetical protein AVEN_136718-1 [Araneus ventricosus]|uniref:Uncharacterized protein n=1 Tax=Araneus ventricosus TaxID=182803 RepID=A0A4Y2EVX8_ARAVE|nr:hypothetical protein AVEN_136718-1 [Araneus ventricosus]
MKQPTDATSSSDSDPDFSPSPKLQTYGLRPSRSSIPRTLFSLPTSEANDHPTPVDFLHRTQMLLAELMFAMCGNANYEPDDIILESTQIIPQTDEDCLDLLIDEPSWIAQKHRKIGMIWSSTVPLMWQATFQKKSLQQIYCELCKSNTCQQRSNCH